MAKVTTGLAASFDIETFGLDPVYGRVLLGVVKPWGQEPKVFRMKRAANDDSKVVKELIEESENYAILFAHNGLFFDRAMLNGRALHHGLKTLSNKGKLVDPCLIARKHLNLRRNSLDSLAAHLELDEQKMHLAPEVWVKAVFDHDEKSMKILVERCISDCAVLEQLATVILPLVGNINPWGST